MGYNTNDITAFSRASPMNLWSKFKDYIICGYLETERNATGEYFAHRHERTGTRAHKFLYNLDKA